MTDQVFSIFKGNHQTFESVIACPACAVGVMHEEFDVAYCEAAHLRGLHTRGQGIEWLDRTLHEEGRSPHLHMTCKRCGFEWTELPAWTKT